MAVQPAALKRSTVSALKWNYLGQGVRMASGLIVGVVLARLLGPKPFGQVAVATIVIGVGNLISDFGFTAALVQSEQVSDREVQFGFSVQVLLGTVLTVLCAVAAGPIAAAFRQPEVAPVIRAIGVMFFLQSLGQTATSLLRRDLAFRSLQLAQVVSYLVGYLALGIPLACLGFGVWALVAAQLCQTALNSVIVYLSVRHPISPLFRHHSAMLGFGFRVLGTNLVNWPIHNLDNLLVGRVYGSFALGLYNRALFLALVPANGTTVLQSVLFSAYSRAQSRPDLLKRVYLASLSLVAAATLPMYAAVAVMPTTLLTVLYGHQWIGAAALLPAFALAMPMYTAVALTGPLLWGVGRVDRELRAQAITVLVAAVVFLTCVRISVVALAWGVMLTYSFRFLLVTAALLRQLSMSWVKVLGAVRGGLGLGTLVTASLGCTNLLLLRYGSSDLLRFITAATVTLAIMIAALLLAPMLTLGNDAVWLLDSLRSSLPPAIHPFLPRPVEKLEPLPMTGA